MVLKAFYESLDYKNVFSLCLVNINIFFNQFVGLGDKRKCILDGLNLELISKTVSPSLDS